MSSDDPRTEELLTTMGAVKMVHAIADMEGIKPPHVSHAIADGIVVADYLEGSRTIRLVGGSATPRTVLHEFQHYLDDLRGQPLEGALRGTHDRSFYRRLRQLEARFAAYVKSQHSEHPAE